MKRILIALAAFALVWPAARQTDAAEVSIDFFYNHLGDEGSWMEVGDYGYCWQPSVAVNNPGWRPYTDGYWAYTDVGWTWVSYESFGWATYHYGRWARLHDHGWVWVPGTEWGPAWVSWRTGGDYVGWAPLPPRRGYSREVVYESRPITGYVDIEFDIGPAYYNFVDVRYIGEPVLRQRIFEPTQNITYINQTVNVTNITYNNNTVYNYGPDYNTLSAYSTRPIQRLRLERASNVDPNLAVQSGALTKVQGDRLVVAAPPRLQKPERIAAPKVVKAKIEKPNVETGWMGIADPQAKAKLQEKMKAEDPKTVPPPQVQPANPAALAGKNDKKDKADPAAPPQTADGSSPPAMNTAPAVAEKGDGKGKDKNKRHDRAAQIPSAPAEVSNDPSAPGVPDAAGRGRGASKRAVRDSSGDREANQPPDAVTPDAALNPAAAQDPPRAPGKGKKKERDAAESLAPAAQPQAAAPPQFNPPAGPQEAQPGPASIPDRGDKPDKRDKGEGRKRNAEPPQTAPQVAPQMQAIPPDLGRGRGGGDGGGEEQQRRNFDRMPRPQAAPPQAPGGGGQPQPQAAPEQPRGKGKPAKEGKGEKEGKEKP